MSRFGTVIVAAISLVALTGAASPPSQPLDWARRYLGAWTLSGVTDGAPYCQLTLGGEGVIGGASIEVSATCRRNFPLEDVAGWSLRGDQLVLIDGLRKAQLSFSPAGSGSYTAKLPNGEVVSLERGRPPAPKSPKALLDGTFTLSGPDNAAACGFSVTAASGVAGKLEQAGECPLRWKGRRWSRWTLSRDRLNLLAADGSAILSLVRLDDFTFGAEGPEGPIFFGPGVVVVPR